MDLTAIPGYASIAEFARAHDMPYMTVRNHLLRGRCKWPKRTIDGKSKNSLYKTWENMITRCNNPKATGYHNYGGRGIKVCGRWLCFSKWLQDMGPKPGPTYTLDRIDVNGNYEPSNCRWATTEEQAHNCRKPLGWLKKHRKRWVVLAYDGKLRKSFSEKKEAKLFLQELREATGDAM